MKGKSGRPRIRRKFKQKREGIKKKVWCVKACAKGMSL
jgi:hypothetical protein